MSDDFEAALAGERDRAEVEALLLEWTRHYLGAPDPARARDAADRLLASSGGMHVMLGRRDGRCVAFAAFAIHHPARSPGGDLHLKHLFVMPQGRGAGTGTMLLRAVAGHAVALGCGRVEWTAGVANERALALYDRLGVPRAELIVQYRLGDGDLAAFAAAGEEGDATGNHTRNDARGAQCPTSSAT